MNQSRVDSFARLVEEKSGIAYGATRKHLLGARLKKRMGALGEDSLGAYWRRVEEDPAEMTLLLDTVTTNQTSFFREEAHFKFLAQELKATEGSFKPVRIWSAACSSGEEPYTLAMTAVEALGEGCNVKILGSDLSYKVLNMATKGVYEERRMAGLNAERRLRFFEHIRGKAEWQVGPQLRSMVGFSRLNLMELPPAPRDLDVIFCRNVMIYFGRPVQQKLVEDLASRLRPGGLLFTGMAENLLTIRHGLEHAGTSIYRRKL